MCERIFIGVGSNLDPERNIRAGLILLSKEIRIGAISNFYKTEPFNAPHSPAFLNGVISAATHMDPGPIRELLQRIEAACGRLRTGDKNAPRPLDLDLLLYGDKIAVEPVLPHPDIYERWYIGVGLSELDPALILPGGLPIAALMGKYPPYQKQAMFEFSSTLRKECKV